MKTRNFRKLFFALALVLVVGTNMISRRTVGKSIW